MKKNLLTIFLIILLLWTILPTTALATGDPKVNAPKELVLSFDEPIRSNTGENIPEGTTKAIRTMLTHDNSYLQAASSETGAYLGNVHYQIRIDGGAWFDQYLNAFADNFSTYSMDITSEHTLIGSYGRYDDLSENDDYQQFKNIVKPHEENSEVWAYIDLNNHLVECRARYELIDAESGSTTAQYFSQWTAIAQLGKGAAAVGAPKAFPTAPVLSDFIVKPNETEGNPPYVTFKTAHPNDVERAASNPLGNAMYYIEVRYDDKSWQSLSFDTVSSLDSSKTEWHPLPSRFDGNNLVVDKTKMEIRMRYEWYTKEHFLPSHDAAINKVSFYSPWSNILGINVDAWSNASAWATTELEKANTAGLIPECLKGQDLTKPINREEFAALAVNLYEVMSGQTATPAATNPFTDTKNIETLKAYNLGITKGVSATLFAPKNLIPREQVATMLVRTVQSFKTDMKLDITGAPIFADAMLISSWAKESVLFMAKNEIIKGNVEGNKTYFKPKNTTKAEEASNYANATREQALLIAIRSLEKLK